MAAAMSHVSRRLDGLLAITWAAVLLIFASTVRAATVCPTGFASFGGSYSDTGNFVSFYPYTTNAEVSPYGETFFGKPSKRFCNGRVVPDFFSLAFSKPLLDPYVKAASFEYQFGINFAQDGATAVPPEPAPNLPGNPPAPPKSPAALYPVQLNQFKRFFNSVVTTESEPPCRNFNASLPLPSGTSWVSQWLYTIEAGTNDLLNILRTNSGNLLNLFSTNNHVVLPRAQNYIIVSIIPRATQGISQTIRELYAVGARRFLVFGIPAVGCNTEMLTLFSNASYPRDNLGCVPDLNNYAQLFNDAILTAIRGLRPMLPDANIAFFDYYAANIQILTTPAAFAFNETFAACCGDPGSGPLKYNPGLICGSPGTTACGTPETYVNWDGEHYTDLFYKIITIFALYGVFTDGGINYATSGCFLDFTKFTDAFTFNQVYPSACQTIFV